MLHVIRNPFDNIGSNCKKHIKSGLPFDILIFQKIIDSHFKMVALNAKLRRNKSFSIIDIYHESFIANPEASLERILNFIGLENVNGYIENCAAATFRIPNKSRYEVEWPEGLKEQVRNRAKKYEFLDQYSFSFDD